MKNPLTTFSRRANLASRGPWSAMSEFENEMDRWFGSRFGSLSNLPLMPEGFDFAPTTDFQETDKEYILKMDIPGIKKNEVKIEIDENRLTVSGERREEKEEKTSKRHYVESNYGSFMRAFTLPQVIDEHKVKAQYNDGILKVIISKTEKSNAKTITIQ